MDASIIENLDYFLETNEGLKYKQELMRQIQNDRKRKSQYSSNSFSDDLIPLKKSNQQTVIESTIQHIDISDDISDRAHDLSTTGNKSTMHDNKTSILNLHSKLLGLQKDVDQLPNVIAKVNAEMAIMSDTLPSAQLKNDFAIWTFQVPIKWKEETFCVPIMEANQVATLNEALQDEIIYLDVVIFSAAYLFSLIFIMCF